MLTITQLASGRLGIKCNYYYRDRLKNIPTAKWDQAMKQWSIEKSALGYLEFEFEGELVYKTPKWILHGEPMPDMSQMYKINTTAQVPDMKIKLYDYQNYGTRFMIDKLLERNWVINADDVGLGKTAQSIAVMKWFYEAKGIHKFIIICKKSVKKQWADEIVKFTDMNNTFWIGYTGETAAKRKKAYKEYDNATYGILITNHHTFLNDYLAISALKPEFAVIDEVHTVKTRGGKMHDRIMYTVSGLPTIFLTGTPIMSRPEDIYGIVQIADKRYFGKWDDFSNRYITYAPNPFGGRFSPLQTVGAKNLDELREKTQDSVIRRTCYEVSIQLPEIVMVRKDVEMDEVQAKLVDAINIKQKEYMDEISSLSSGMKPEDAESNGFKQSKLLMLEALSKGLIASKQAAATDPRLFKMSTSQKIRDEFGAMVPSTYKASPKTLAVIDLVEDICASGNKVLLFSKFRTSAMLMADDIRNALKLEVLTYTGSEDQVTRDKYVDMFRNTDVFNILIGTEAMSDSLNLQVANYVINIDQPDTFATKTQRIGRARRTGSQFTNVTVYDMITENSKDTERLENINRNMDLTDALISLDDAQRMALINAMKNE